MPSSKRHPARRPQQRPSKPGHRRPGAPATPPPVAATGFRGWLESWSIGPLTFLSTLPTWLVPGLLAVMLLAGLAVPSPWAAAFLVVVALFLAWLAALSWPRTSTAGRLGRIAVTLLVAGAAVAKALGIF